MNAEVATNAEVAMNAEGATNAEGPINAERTTNGKGTASAVPLVGESVAALAAEGTTLVREQALRSATGASRKILDGMIRKKWITRADISAQQDAARTIKIAVLNSAEGKLNKNQQTIIDTLVATGGRIPVATLQSLEVPRSTLAPLFVAD